MKILIIGGGGREHAIAAKIVEAGGDRNTTVEIHAAPGNAGIAAMGIMCHSDVKADDIAEIILLAKEIEADRVIVTPDDPLVLGAVDRLNEAGFKTFGPSKNAAIIEGSKLFAKEFMARHGIPTAEYKAFTNFETAKEYLQSGIKYPVAVKANGLALGKGVVIAKTAGEAVEAITDMMIEHKFGESGTTVVVEEFLVGREVSVLVLTDGTTAVPLSSATDHKRAFDGDLGGNTGGMGVVAPSPYYTFEISQETEEKIIQPTLAGLREEGRIFKGCLYFGLMLTADGPKVIEYNCRFGDPETQAVLQLLDGNILKIMDAIDEGCLDTVPIRVKRKHAVCVAMASGGYPESYEKGFFVTGLRADGQVNDRDVQIFHAGTETVKDVRGTAIGFRTSGGRVLGVTAVGGSLSAALDKAYVAAGNIHWEGARYRGDIGRAALEYKQKAI